MSAAILVIDDDPKIKAALEAVLPRYEFLGALNGEDGLKLLGKPNEIDLVFLDFRMRGLNGIEVLKKIKELRPGIGVFMFTGFSSKEVAVEALRGRADDFLEKPFDPGEVENKVEKFLELKCKSGADAEAPQDAVDRVIRFLERNYDKPLSLAEAARFACLSPKYLSRIFREKTAKSFTRFRLGLRMEKAKKMLKESSLTVKEVAEKLGYGNAESFIRMFEKIVRATPTEYRRRRET